MYAREALPTPVESARHEFVDHTSEMTIRARAPSFRELVAELTRAFVGLVPVRARGTPTGPEREFRVEAPDRTALLVDWINELVYLGEAESWLPTELRIDARSEGTLHIRARGNALTEPFVLVKAATLHGAHVRETSVGVEAEVTLDL